MKATLRAFITTQIFSLFFIIAISSVLSLSAMFAIHVRVSEDLRISTLLSSISNLASRLSETVEFGDKKSTDYILDHLNREFPEESFYLSDKEPSCDVFSYYVGGFEVCWHFISLSPLVYRNMGKQSMNELLVIEHKTANYSPIFRWLWLNAIALIAILVGAIVFFYGRIKKSVLQPLQELHRSLISNKEYKPKFVLSEFQDLSMAIEDNKEQAKFRIQAKALNMIVHDVKKPLDTLIKFAHRIASLPTEEIKSYVERQTDFLSGQRDRANLLIADLRSMNDSSLERSGFPFLKMIESVISGVDVEVKLTANCPDFIFSGDNRKLQRAFINILENAKSEKEKNEKVKIWINVRKEHNAISIEIGNTGSKVDDRILESIFNDFVSSGKPDGTGLGLSIAKKFIALHMGKITCTSACERVVFNIELPIV